MSRKVVAMNQQNVSVRLRVLDDTDGTPATGLNAASAGQEIWYQRGENNVLVTDAGAASDLASITAAHVDWGMIHIREGWYRIDLPDAAFLQNEGSVITSINPTGFSGISETIIIESLFKFQGLVVSATAMTTTFPTGTNPRAGDTIFIPGGTGIGQTVLVTSASVDVATHNAFDVPISATTSSVLLIAGYSQHANLDAAISSRSVLTAPQVGVEVDASLVNAVNVSANVNQVNGVIVTGDGQPGTEWGP